MTSKEKINTVNQTFGYAPIARRLIGTIPIFASLPFAIWAYVGYDIYLERQEGLMLIGFSLIAISSFLVGITTILTGHKNKIVLTESNIVLFGHFGQRKIIINSIESISSSLGSLTICTKSKKYRIDGGSFNSMNELTQFITFLQEKVPHISISDFNYQNVLEA